METDGSQEYRAAPRLLTPLVPDAIAYAGSGIQPRIHRGLPSPSLTFIFSLDGPVVSGETEAEAYGTGAGRHEVLVGGLVSRPAYVVQPDHHAGIQLAVHPLAARAIFGMPAAELRMLAADGRDVLGSEVARILDRLHAARGWDGRFDLVRDYLRSRVDRHRTGHPRDDLIEAWTWMARFRGTGSMDGLCRHVHVSGRHLRTLFQREIGMGPKQVSRLMRFDQAKHLIASTVAAGRTLDLTSVALQCGFYDHAHLDRDFGALAGISPTGWLAEERRTFQVGGHWARADSST